MGLEELAKIRKILVPVDYSKCSNLAGRYALKVARQSEAGIRFFHAFYSPAYDLIELAGNKNMQLRLKADVTSKLLESESQEMQSFLDGLKEYPEFREFDKERISSELSPGLAKEEIQKICSEYKPDLVIMGTKGRNIHENAIIGSLTEFAINKLRYPVLAIPEHYSFIGEKNLKRIAYLTDFDETDFGSIKKLMSFTSLLGLTICCAHIGGKSDNWDRLKMDGLRNYFKNVYKETQVECEILKPGENILHSIDDYIKRNSINILSLTSRRRNIIEKLTKPSFTRKLFYHTNIPLLVFHS